MKNTAKKGLLVLVLAALFTGVTLSLTLASCELIDNIRSSLDSGDDTVPTYTVSFNLNGGTGTPPRARIVTAGYPMAIPGGSGLYRSGYTFGGWNTNSSGSGINYPADSYLTPNANIVLYAKWNYSSGIIPSNDFDDIAGLDNKLEWLQANAQRGGDYIIELWANESTSLLNLSFGNRTNITITVKGVISNRTISLSSNGTIFYVGRGVTLVLDRNITLRGRSSNTSPLVYVDGGTLMMKDGSAIINNNYRGVEVDNGSFIMEGGTISGNRVRDAGGGGVIVRDGTFTMTGGRITGNKADWGGGVLIYGGSFTKDGGIITGNDEPDGDGNQANDRWGGHAVYAYGGVIKTRDKTAGPEVSLTYNNGVSSGAWE